MCGFVGIYGNNKEYINEGVLNKMSNEIIHRGPDAEGIWINDKDCIGMAHRRLSILDTSQNGRQPMHHTKNEISIIFNGEIYNFLELKAKLTKHKDLNWSSNSDTEVILNLYQYSPQHYLFYY